MVVTQDFRYTPIISLGDYTHNLMKALSSKYFCKLISIVFAIILFTFVGSIGGSGYAWADTFCGYEKCGNPNATLRKKLKDSEKCKEGKNNDYEFFPAPKTSDVTVLSIHGGGIEEYTSEISHDLSQRYGWSRYDFNGHIKTKKCLELAPPQSKNPNFTVLHITSNYFDEKNAFNLVSSHENAVSIHGYSRKEEAGIQTICVGGRNTEKIKKFINYVNQESYQLKGNLNYSLNLVNVPLDQANLEKNIAVPERNTICLKNEALKQRALTGTSQKNIVNKTRNSSGGLQIELKKKIRADLAEGKDEPQASSPNKNQLLRNVIYGGIEAAMSERVIARR